MLRDVSILCRGLLANSKGLKEKLDASIREFLAENKWTRRRPDQRGSQLHFYNTMRCIATYQSCDKLFSKKTAGGRRSYAVSLVLDTSLSMQGPMLASSMQVVVSLLEAFKQLDMARGEVYLANSNVTLVKESHEEISREVIARLLLAVDHESRDDQPSGSRIGLATMYAIDGLQQAHDAKEKLVFVFTDGMDQDPLMLSLA